VGAILIVGEQPWLTHHWGGGGGRGEKLPGPDAITGTAMLRMEGHRGVGGG